MNDYIKEYLLEHGKVQVNNFGVFELIYKSAQIHPVLHTVTAPGRYVVFSENLISNAPELSKFVAAKESITIDKANNKIEEWVQSIKETIALKKDYPLGSFGKFFSNAMGKIEFIPLLDTDISTESFGLEESTIQLKPSVKTSHEKKAEVKINAKPDISPEDTDDNKEEKKPKRGGRIAFLVILFSLLLMVLGTGFTYFMYPEMLKPYIEKLHLLKNEQKNNATEEIKVDEPEATQENNIVEENTFVEETKTAEESKSNVVEPSNPSQENRKEKTFKTGSYYVIIGSFQREVNAQKFLNEKQKEYSNVLNLGKGQHSTLYMIGIGPYATEAEAETQKNNGKAGWWILKK